MFPLSSIKRRTRNDGAIRKLILVHSIRTARAHAGRAFPTLSPFYLEHALPLIAYLRSLPNPHGASSSSLISSTYASVRGAYLEESLKPAAREALEDARLDKVQQGQSPRPGSGNASTGATGSNRRRTLGRLLDALLAMLKVRSTVTANSHAWKESLTWSFPLARRLRRSCCIYSRSTRSSPRSFSLNRQTPLPRRRRRPFPYRTFKGFTLHYSLQLSPF